MTEVIFKNRKLNIAKLLSFGFEAVADGYVYRAPLVGGQMTLTVKVDGGRRLYAEITDNGSGEEYVLHRVAEATGAFVGQVRADYEAVLDDIATGCFENDVFKTKQAKAVIAYVRDTYGDEPEYLWQKFPNNAVVRRQDNQKWYAAILTVSRCKLSFDTDEPVEILDLRIRPEEMESTVDNLRYFPGYHMNKKHWFTVCLDGTVAMSEICRRIDDSYRLARK